MKTITPSKTKGFTLIELLLVIAILGILVVMGLASFTSSLQKGRDSKRKNDVRQIGLALESYFADKGTYPLGNAGVIVGCHTPVESCTWGSAFTDDVTIYMTQLPADSPSDAKKYYYVSTDGTYFQLYARLENAKDNDIVHNAEQQMRVFTNTNCGNGTTTIHCNYGMSSTNKAVTDGQVTAYE